MPDDKTPPRATAAASHRADTPDRLVEKPEKSADKSKDTSAVVAAAAESGDAAVQDLLARRAIHESNGDDDAVADVDRQLAERVGK